MNPTRPNIEAMTQAQFAAFQKTPRVCRGPCQRLLTVGDFQITSEHGKKVVRYLCHECLKAYYRSKTTKERRKKRRLRVGEKFGVERNRLGWSVIGKVEGMRTRVISVHATEQEAERGVPQVED